MTNEHDLEIAKIGAALQVLVMADSAKFLKEKAENFLLVHFHNKPVVDTASPMASVNLQQGSKPLVLRCVNIKPGRTNLLADAARCTRTLGHDGPCDFNAVVT